MRPVRGKGRLVTSPSDTGAFTDRDTAPAPKEERMGITPGPDGVARLRVTCPDKPGIVAAVSGFLYAHGVNITALDQHSTDPEGGTFFLRLEYQTFHMDVTRKALETAFAEVIAARFGMQWEITYAADRKRTAVLVSRAGHALLELLWLWKTGKLPAEIGVVISNHEDLRPDVESFGIPFAHVPVDPARREEAEERMLALLGGTDLVVLARYMQVLSGEVVSRFPNRMINIHHSFLPAFAGADPYRQARERGVKIIGATAHYVIEELDAGPIIEQDTVRVSHRDGMEELKDLGRDLERRVLARAVRWHLEDRIIVHEGKTIVFT
jgi:formyltetrahydrofolate deformylase